MRLIDAEQFDVFAYEEKENGTFTDGVMMILEAIDNAPTVEPCEDAISREAVKEEIRKPLWKIVNKPELIASINDIPTVAPSRPSGEWIEETHIDGHTYCTCSECLHVRIPDNFCPNCGAEMKGADNE